MEVTKLDDHRIAENPVLIELNEFLTNAVNDFTPMAIKKQLRLVLDLENSDINPKLYVQVDKDHLYEVMQNLIENAIKYTKQGEIHVGVKTGLETLQIYVKDSGIGITVDDLPHLFQKFYRADNSDTREIGGTGLGLYLTKVLVDNMQGRISVESQLGVGSTFFVELPRLSEDRVELILQNNSFMVK